MQWLRSSLINQNYARLWCGQAVSTIGDYVFDTTLVLWVGTVLARGRTWAPVAVSGILLSAGLAILLVGPLAGVFVDRWNRKRTMMRTEVLRAFLVAGLAGISLVPSGDIPVLVWLIVIYVVVFVLNSASQFFSPARFATVGEVVPGDVDRARAAGIGQATVAVAAILGPPLAAPLLFVFGVKWALAIDVLSYVFSYFAIRSVRLNGHTVTTASEPVSVGQGHGKMHSLLVDFMAGIHFFKGSRLLMALLGMAIIAQFGTGALITLGIFFVTENLHAPAHLFGFLSMAFGTGAILGSIWSGRAVRFMGARTLTWFGLLIAGLLVLVYSRQSTFIGGLIMYGLLSIPVAMLNTAMTPLLLKSAPPEFLGRVVAVFNPLNQLASMVSVVVAGWLASTVLRGFHATLIGIHLGSIDLIYAVAGILIVAAAACGSVALPADRAVPSGAAVEKEMV